MIISSKRFIDSCVVLKCFMLALSGKDGGKIARGKFVLVFPLYMSCVGRNLFEQVMSKVAVIDFLKTIPAIGTCFDPFWRDCLKLEDILEESQQSS